MEAGVERRSWVQRVWPAASFQFAFVAAVALLKTSANALVLARFHAGTLPYLYLGAAGITVGLSGYAAVHGRRATVGTSGLSVAGAGVAALLALGIALGQSWAALALYLFAEAFATWLAITFWKALSDAFDSREARRAFTEVNGIGMVGGTAGGLLAQELAKREGAIALLLAASLLLFVAAGVFRFHRAGDPQPRRPKVVPGEVLGYITTHGYARALVALVLSFSALSAFADYLFRERAARALGENQLAALFGNQQLWIGMLCVVFQLLLAAPLLRRIGLVRYLALVPLVLAPLAVATLVDQRLWPAYLLKLFEASASLSILPVGMQLLYAPVPDTLRDRVRSAIDGMVRKGGLAIGALLLIGAGVYASGPVLGLGVVAMCGVAGVALWRLHPLYVRALHERVAGRGGRPEIAVEGLEEKTLIEALGSPSSDRVLHAMSLMEQASLDLRPHLSGLLHHSEERVVERAVQLALKLDARETAAEMESLIDSSERRPRDLAVWALARLAPERAGRLLPTLLESTDVGLRCAVIGAMVGMEGGGYPVQLALQQLAAKGALAPAAERREVARLFGRLGDENWTPFLARYLEDGDGSVRRVAISAVAEGKFASLAPRLLGFLTWREERRIAREALAQLGDAALPAVEAALNDRTRASALRYQLPRVLRQIGTQRALEALLFSNVRDDGFLHYRIGVALWRLREQRPRLQVDHNWVREALARRRNLYRTLVEPFRDLRAGLGDASLLTRAVGDRLDQAYELSFWLLGLISEPRALRRVHQHIVGSDPRRRAYALDLLEHLSSPEDRELLMEQTEAHHRALPLGASGRVTEHLGVLCHSDDYLLRACARELARRVGLWQKPAGEDDMSEATLKRMFALESVEIFAQSDVDDIAAVAEVARELSFRKGERIYAEGDPGDALYVILKGSVEAIHQKELVLVLKEKEAFGDVSLLDGSPRPTDIIAAEDLEVLMIDRQDFLDLVSDRPELLKGVFRAVSRQLKSLIDVQGRRVSGDYPRVG